MLRVGLTGGLGSGKTTVARIFAGLGAYVISADEEAQRLMQPGQQVYAAIVSAFGDAVVQMDGALNRKALADLAFRNHQLPALNRIVHPATVAAEEQWMRGVFERDPAAVAIVESALIFEVQKWKTAPGWSERFDKLILVKAPEAIKISRFVARATAAVLDPLQREAMVESAVQDAKARLAAQIPDEEKELHCDYVIENGGPMEELPRQAAAIYAQLQAESRSRFLADNSDRL